MTHSACKHNPQPSPCFRTNEATAFQSTQHKAQENQAVSSISEASQTKTDWTSEERQNCLLSLSDYIFASENVLQKAGADRGAQFSAAWERQGKQQRRGCRGARVSGRGEGWVASVYSVLTRLES